MSKNANEIRRQSLQSNGEDLKDPVEKLEPHPNLTSDLSKVRMKSYLNWDSASWRMCRASLNHSGYVVRVHLA
jgi:hypothetical protein